MLNQSEKITALYCRLSRDDYISIGQIQEEYAVKRNSEIEEETNMDNCIFCKIIKGELPSRKVYEDEFTLSFMDIAKDVDGHILVIPKEHCKNILD